MLDKKYWLMKSEPSVFSIEDLRNSPGGIACWDGVRNYQARNFMRDEMRKGDLVLFYHSNCKEVGIAGIAEIYRESYPDYTSWDSKSKYYDSKSTAEKPRWFMVDVKWKKTFSDVILLSDLKRRKELKDMKLLQKGNRLSIMPITEKHFNIITK